MLPRGTRRDLVDSVRLLGGPERRLFLGLVLGAVGYPVWLAGTGVAVDQFLAAAVGPVSVVPWSSDADLLLATYLLLWVVGPSLLAVWFVVDELTNIRGNIANHYRVNHPVALVAPPAVAFVVALVGAAVTGFGFWSLFAVGGASVVVLVRTVAYGYRVYALSLPRLLQGLLFAAAVGTTLAVASRSARLAGQETLVRAAATQYGVQTVAFGSVDLAVASVDALPFAGAVAPGALALTYVGCQLIAGQVVRIRRPDVPRSAVRAGQRYPTAIQPATGGRPTVELTADETGAGAGNGDTTAEGGAATGSETESDPPADEPFGDTRVYDPADEDRQSEHSGGSVKNELCPVCGATYAADPDRTHCPNCNAVIRE